MRFNLQLKEYKTEWHDVFIWFPQMIRDGETGRRFLVWLEAVRCRRTYFKNTVFWEYKIKWPEYRDYV